MGYVYRSPSEKTGQPRLSTKKVFDIFSEKLRPVTTYKEDHIIDGCKYVRLARRHNYTNYRLLFYKDIKPWGLLGSFSTFQSQFFADSGCTLGIFNTMNNNLISIVWRAINEKEFMNHCLQYTLYGYDLINPDFKYGDWLVLTEGIFDCDVLRQIYPNTMATLTSSVTVHMAEVLKLLTDKFIIAYDSDKAGESGFDKAFKRLSNEEGNNVKKLPVFPGDKDVGEMEEKIEVSEKEFQIRYKYYDETLKEIMNDVSSSAIFL